MGGPFVVKPWIRSFCFSAGYQVQAVPECFAKI